MGRRGRRSRAKLSLAGSFCPDLMLDWWWRLRKSYFAKQGRSGMEFQNELYMVCENCHCHQAVDRYLSFWVRILVRGCHKGVSLCHNSHNLRILMVLYYTTGESGNLPKINLSRELVRGDFKISTFHIIRMLFRSSGHFSYHPYLSQIIQTLFRSYGNF